LSLLHCYLSPLEAPPLPIATLSGREFNQDTSRAKKAASEGPALITDRGTRHVLLTHHGQAPAPG